MTHSLVNDKTSPVEFFITEDCNGCGICKDEAPDFFDSVEYTYTFYLSRQPASHDEISLMRDIAAKCPVDALRQVERSDN